MVLFHQTFRNMSEVQLPTSLSLLGDQSRIQSPTERTATSLSAGLIIIRWFTLVGTATSTPAKLNTHKLFLATHVVVDPHTSPALHVQIFSIIHAIYPNLGWFLAVDLRSPISSPLVGTSAIVHHNSHSYRASIGDTTDEHCRQTNSSIK
jgi:hypothetical protein